jgi:phage terminase large subunit
MLTTAKPSLFQTLIETLANGLVPETTTNDRLQAGIDKAYGGSWDAYEQAISVLAPDQRANYERAGIVLQPKQIAFAKAARDADHLDNPNEIGIGGARGGGKSFNVFSQIAVDDCIRFPGLKVLYLRKTAKAGQEQMRDLVERTLAHVPCTPLATRIEFANGSRIVIGGFKDDKEAMKYQGIEFDTLVIEELTQLSEHTYKTLRLSARSSKGWRPRYYNTFNPLGIGHQWVKKRFVDPFRQGEQGKTRFIPSTVEDNAFNNVEYIENLDDLSGAELRAFRYGDWDVLAGAYFEVWDYNTHVIKPLTEIPKHWRIYASMDAGFQHWNMIYFHAEDTDGNTYTFHELAHRKHHPDTIAPDIHAALAGYGLKTHDLNFFTVGTDAFRLVAGQQATLADQYLLHNIALIPADMSPGSRIMGWQLMNRMLGDPRNDKRPRWFITDNCRMLKDSLPYAERDPRNPEDVLKWDTDEDGKGGDDPLDGVRYGLAMANTGIGNYTGSLNIAQYNTLSGAM